MEKEELTAKEQLKELMKEALTEVLKEYGLIREKPPVREPEKYIIKKYIDETVLSDSIVNTLKGNGIYTIQDLLRYSRKAINSLRGMGSKKMAVLDAYMKDNGFEYGQLPPKYSVRFGRHGWTIRDTQNNSMELPATCRTYQEAEEFLNDLVEKGQTRSWMKS